MEYFPENPSGLRNRQSPSSVSSPAAAGDETMTTGDPDVVPLPDEVLDDVDERSAVAKWSLATVQQVRRGIEELAGNHKTFLPRWKPFLIESGLQHSPPPDSPMREAASVLARIHYAIEDRPLEKRKILDDARRILSEIDSAEEAAVARELYHFIKELQERRRKDLEGLCEKMESTTKEMIQEMSPEEKVALLGAIINHYPGVAGLKNEEMEKVRTRQKRLLGELYKSIDLGAMYDESGDKRLIAALRDRLKKTCLDVCRNWHAMNREEKRTALDGIVATYCELLDIEKPEVTLKKSVEKPKQPQDENDTADSENVTLALFSASDEEVKIFTFDRPGEPLDDFDEALTRVIHENTHNYQLRLALNLSASHPKEFEYATEEQAVLFALNGTLGGHIKPSPEFAEAYADQPIEKHARKIGEAMAGLFHKEAKSAAEAFLTDYELNGTIFQNILERVLTNGSASAVFGKIEEIKNRYLKFFQQG